MKALATSISDVVLLEPKVFEDTRGTFFESYNERALAELGIRGPFVQDNQSFSRRDVVRGLHYQIHQPQGKLIRCLKRRRNLRRRARSPALFAHILPMGGCKVLSSSNRKMLWIPPGFAHGFMVLSEGAEVLYKATDFYAPQHERTLSMERPGIKD